MSRMGKKVQKKMAAEGWLRPGEEVRAALVTFPVGHLGNPTGGGTSPATGVVTDLLVVGPLSKKLGKALYGDDHHDMSAEVDPDKGLAVTTMNTALTVTDHRVLVHEWKGMGKLGDLYGEAPRSECVLVTDDGGKGPSRHRLLHLTLPDGQWVLREVGLVAGGEKNADEFAQALTGP
ncbi:MAG: hypothetical protein AAGK32_09215 [Actinomycetota bacterium]